MNWEQKFAACKGLAPITLQMRCPGDWYVSHRVEKCDGHVLESAPNSGSTPEDAVNNHWTWLTALKPDESIVVNAMDKNLRRAYRWNGFMWAEVAL